VPRTRDRAYATAQCSRWTVPVIAEIFECHEHTVRQRWQDKGLGVMGGSRTGCKTKWQEADLQTVEQWIEQDARTIVINWLRSYPSRGRSSPKAIATPSTKKGFGWKRTRHSHRGKQDPEQNNSNKPTSIQLAAQGATSTWNIWMNRDAVCGVPSVTAIVALESKSDWSKLNDEDALAFWGFGNQTKGLNMRFVAVTVQATSQWWTG